MDLAVKLTYHSVQKRSKRKIFIKFLNMNWHKNKNVNFHHGEHGEHGVKAKKKKLRDLRVLRGYFFTIYAICHLIHKILYLANIINLFLLYPVSLCKNIYEIDIFTNNFI